MRHIQYTLKELADQLGGRLIGDENCIIHGLATLEEASAGHLSFFTNSRYLSKLQDTAASAVLVAEESSEAVRCNAIVLSNPYLAYARASRLFERTAPVVPGVHPSAIVSLDAEVASAAEVCANAVIGPGTKVEAGAYIGANSVVGADCRVGQNVRIGANVTLYDDVQVGEGSVIHSGAVIGADGFGFANERGKWIKIAQLGGVRIGSNVEIGAGTTIDRGALSDTVISDGVKLDNQIQIAHNVTIGEDTAIAGCTAVAGSTKIGARCTIAGATGITGHLDICDGTHITAMSLVSKPIREAGAYSSGTGLMPHTQWKRSVVRFRQLDELAKRIKTLEEKIESSKG